MDECVEQHTQHQQHATWEVCAVSAEAADRDLKARLSEANEDRRAAGTELAAIRRDKDRLASRTKTLERDLATARKATGDRPPGQTGEGEPEGPTAERAGWGGNPAVVRYLLPGSQAGHARAEAVARPM